MKVDKPFRIQLTAGAEARAIAFMVSILLPFGDYERDRVLKAVCAFFGFSVVRL